jgi:hypothetical protein
MFCDDDVVIVLDRCERVRGRSQDDDDECDDDVEAYDSVLQ